jgi:16S rRNA (cytosine967-C5)-methyltransferase
VSITANQQRTLLRLLAALQPHWRRDRALPSRIQSLLTRERAFGSRDRRLYRELLYTAIRHLPWIEPWLASDPAEAVRRLAWLAADLPATAAFRAAFATGSPRPTLAPAADRRARRGSGGGGVRGPRLDVGTLGRADRRARTSH